jgi:adenylyl- and sulfurtransferase ThiI
LFETNKVSLENFSVTNQPIKRPLETTEATESQPIEKKLKTEDIEIASQSKRQKIYIFDPTSKCKQIQEELMKKKFDVRYREELWENNISDVKFLEQRIMNEVNGVFSHHFIFQ